MDLQEAIYTRRSIRKYTDRKVPDDVIAQIIEAGTWAPSACNIQGWRFIVIDDPNKISEIYSHGGAALLKHTHQAILVLYDNQTDNTMYNDFIQSAAACIQNMLLMAHSLNVGTCWINFLPTKRKLREIFKIPREYDPIALISLGYFSVSVNKRARKYNTDDLISKNIYDSSSVKSSPKSRIKVSIKRFLRKLYFIFPDKRLLDSILSRLEKKFDN